MPDLHSLKLAPNIWLLGDERLRKDDNSGSLF